MLLAQHHETTKHSTCLSRNKLCNVSGHNRFTLQYLLVRSNHETVPIVETERFGALAWVDFGFVQ